MNNSDFLTYAEVSKITGLKVGTLYSMVHRREIPHARLGSRTVRFSRTEIDLWIAERSVLPPREPTLATSWKGDGK